MDLNKIHPEKSKNISEFIIEEKQEIIIEKWYQILAQTIFPFLIAGFGMVAAGVLLDYVNGTVLFQEVGQILILVPSLLGLKGNLEMTLAARLSTQLQSIVVGFLASIVACVTELIKVKEFHPENLLMLLTSSITTASLASLFLGLLIIGIIILSKKFNINPDNVATPIASSLGDIVTLTILSLVGSIYYKYRALFWIHIIVLTAYIILMPIFFYFCFRNEFVKETLHQGWVPIIIAMFISSFAGIILDSAVDKYPSLPNYQPVVNGVGGNLVSILASRLSTILFETSKPGEWAPWAPKKFWLFPYDTFFGKTNYESSTAKVLVFLGVFGHTIFFFSVFYIRTATKRPDLTVWLVLFYLLTSLTQVLILLLVCYFIVHAVWKFGKNPDNICIPLLTSSGDLIGTTLLYLCFYLAYLAGNTSLKISDENFTSTTSINSLLAVLV